MPVASEPPTPTPLAPLAEKKRGRRGIWVAGGVGLLLIAGAAGAGIALLGGDDEPKRPVQPGGSVEPTTSLLGAPGHEWRIRAEDLVDEPGATFASPFFRGEGQSVTPTLLPGLVVTFVSSYDEVTDESRTWLVGLDPETGERTWAEENEDGLWPTCVPLADQKRLACYTVEWDEVTEKSSSEVVVRDASTGRVVGSQEFGYGIGDIRGVGDRIWTIGVDSDWETGTHRVHLTAGGASDLTDDVDRETRLVEDQEDYGESWTMLQSDGSRLWATVAGKSFRIDTGTGELVEDTTVNVASDEKGKPIVVHEEDGQSWLEGSEDRFDGTVWDAWAGKQVVRRGMVGVGRTLVRRDTGALVRTVIDDEAEASWVNDDVLRVSDWSDEETDVWFEAASTGEVLWRDRQGRWSWASISDAFLSFAPDSDTFDVRSAWTGDVAWSRELPVTKTDDGDTWQMTTDIATWTDGLVVTSEETMFGFTDFGTPDPDLLRVPEGISASSAPEGTDDRAADELPLGDEYVTACGSEPEFVPVESEGGPAGVEVTYEVTATCPGGQWLDSPAYRIDLTGDDDGEEVQLATGVFDFSADRVWIPEAGSGESGSRVTTTFPVSQVWATPEEIGGYIERAAILVDCVREESGSEEERAPEDRGATDAGDAASSADVTDPDTREENSLTALRRMAAQDKEYVLANLADRWLPQLSSKQDGTHDRVDEKTYDYTAIYEEHLRLRLEYPDVRLLWSSDWGSFERPGYWVTVVGRGSARPKPALAWCRSTDRAPSQCYAKLVRVAGPYEGTTRLQR
ncbi:hypothetical protein [Nocardioides daejeonensis]|uniref:hypothetical protein n=1 Tax=Nocardioides daejeonensis TaxID=1046556 RepID=UPI000D7410B7|nr:hypothetical protein [Nocardioides daejeonensis]